MINAKKDFELFTQKQALKKNTVELCGQEFIDQLTSQGIYAKDEQFWVEVNQHLNIPSSEKQQAETLAREKVEQERLLQNKQKLFQRERREWMISVYELPPSEIYGKKYMAEARKEHDVIITTDCQYWGNKSNHAYSIICSILDKDINKQKQIKDEAERYQMFLEDYLVLKPLYLMILYLSGWDEYNSCLSGDITKDERCKENFTGIQSWIGLQFKILDFLQTEGLLEQPQKGGKNYKKVTYVELTKKGIKLARDVLKQINLDGVESLLSQRDYHEDYLHYQSNLDIRRETTDDRKDQDPD